MKRPLLWCALLCVSLGSAQTPAYLDDRSTSVSLLRSFYNAVNRREYARAYSYWRTDSLQPAGLPPYAAFVRGYEDTRSVRLVTGAVRSEGGAGSIYSSVPVRLEATRTDGTVATFVGCYSLRLVQPLVQEPPFRPLRLTGGALRQVTSPQPVPPARLCRDAP